MPIWIEEVRWATHESELKAIRHAVFIIGQGISPADEWDTRDPACRHFMAYHDGRPVGCARLLDRTKIGRMAVLDHARSQGVGSQLLLAAITAIRATSGRATLGAQLTAMGFYAAHGFLAEGPIFDDAGIPHRQMWLDTAMPFQLRPQRIDTHQNALCFDTPHASHRLIPEIRGTHWQYRLPQIDGFPESWLVPRLLAYARLHGAGEITLFTEAGPVYFPAE